MKLTCTVCRHVIPGSDFNESTDLAFCHHCGTEQSVSQLLRLTEVDAEYFQEFARKHVSSDRPNQLCIRSKFHGLFAKLLFASLFTVMVVLVGNMQIKGGMMGTIIFSSITIFLWLGIAYHLFGKVRIAVERGTLFYDILCGPLRIWSKQIPVRFDSTTSISHCKTIKNTRTLWYSRTKCYQLEIETDGKTFTLGGHALDDEDIENILLWIDGKLSELTPKVDCVMDHAMRLTCLACQRSIVRADYNIAHNRAYCRACDKEYQLNRLRRLREVETEGFQKFVRRHSLAPDELQITPDRFVLWVLLPFTAIASLPPISLVHYLLTGKPIPFLGWIVASVFCVVAVFTWIFLAYILFGRARFTFKDGLFFYRAYIGPVVTRTRQIPVTAATTVLIANSKQSDRATNRFELILETGKKSIAFGGITINDRQLDPVLLWIQMKLSERWNSSCS